MKTICKLAAIALLFLFFSCDGEEDNNLIPNVEMPAWLVKQINEDQSIINTDSMRMQNFGAWIRYEFKREYYYEYDNPLSSVAETIYSQKGDPISTLNPPYANYRNDRCCGLYLWKAPKYIEIK